MQHKDSPTMASPFDRLPRIIRLGIRLFVIICVVALVSLLMNWVQQRVGLIQGRGGRLVLSGVLVLGLLAYAVLMAIPFVPGVEIGISLLMMQGARIAPFVFLATFSGLTLAFLLGKQLKLTALRNLFRDTGLKRVCEMLDRLEPLSQQERLAVMQESLPGWLRGPLLNWRYVTIALALNLPGNAFVGGGGGIAMAAGISGLFSTSRILVTFALAVSPVPIAVILFGPEVLDWWQDSAG